MTQLKVLIPLDGSKLAEASLSYVSALRALGDVQLMLFSVVDESEEIRTLDTQEAMEREQNVLSSYLRDVGNDIQKHLGLPSETRVAYGNPTEQILNVAKEFDPDLLVISTHGRTGRSRWRLGSVADKVIRAAPCNLMVMGPKAAEAADWFAEISVPFKSVLVPLDGSRLAEEAIPVAQRFGDRYGSTLHFVRIVTVPIYGDISGDIAYPGLLEVMESTAEQYLASIQRRPGMPESTIPKVLIGAPASELEAYIETNHIDLVVMTTHGRGGISRAALGSVTDRLLGSPAPILVVKPAGESSES